MQFGKSEQGAESAGQPGRFGRFYLQELINRGGVAEVWGATDSNGQSYALRRMLNNSLFNFTERKRFFHGCEVLSKIHHNEYVVNYVEHGKIEGTPYLLMDFVAGSNLKLLIGKADPVLAENVAQIVLDMSLGLEQVHDSGFIHLDFKPENIIVTPNANVRLIDFDLAQPKPDEPKKMSGNPGTPAYMSPEHLQHQPIDQRADVFAFGATAYEVLTGAKPFPGETPDEILRKQLNDELIAPRELNADIPLTLEKILLKCLERDMGERYPYMSVVVRDLQAALYV
ncbi:MAG TPA: serine/threonine-protein kinase [Verrucomicrobiae bacterium]|jgi:serine/threonine-protein kinase|nr:serine/threonine-protein kinase [Verrucomicrobiae bacterium]